jgi:iron complex outermembrane receptor protein
LSNDDLRCSGATTVADALRLVPGLQVAAIDSGNWASPRAASIPICEQVAGNDGRSDGLFAVVLRSFWDAQQVFLDDVDRIEVIRGPGATVWR